MQFYDDNQTPNQTHERLQHAAASLVSVLKFLERDIPQEVLDEAKNEFAQQGKFENQLMAILDELLEKDVKKLNELLDADTDESRSLLKAWISHHEFYRNYSVNALRALRTLTDPDGTVAIHHEAGVYTGWIQQGTRSWPDPETKTHALRMPATNLIVRSSTDAGGKFSYLAYPCPSNPKVFYIVRVKGGKLVTGQANLPNWMY